MTRARLPVLLLLLLLPFPAAAGPAANVQSWLVEARGQVPQLTTDKLKDLIDSDRDFVLVDVRLPEERREQGRLAPFREVAIPRGYLEFRAPDKLADTDARIIVYCGSGKRSLLAARTLQRLGYTNVSNYAGGLKAWKNAGHEVAR
ncbi:MAG: rhodanese-like domain-containing protein [Thiohalorhabdaceae bacterium]